MEAVRVLGPASASPEQKEGERALVERARRRDEQAFRAIFDRYAPAVRRFLRDLLRNDEKAEEATQETFVRAHEKLDALREDQKLAGWLFGIARNVYFEAIRARAADELADEDDLAVVNAVLPTPTPEAVLLDRELESAMDDALGKIAPERRAALLLRIDHGLPYEEIASVMGWNLQKVKNEIHRARLKLRVMLAGHIGGRT